MPRTTLFRIALLLATTTSAGGVLATQPVVLFPYFNSNGENGVFLAWSSDGRQFHSVNDGQPIFMPPKWGQGQHLTRDPSITYHDGIFHMVWTSNWNGRWFGYASSSDLRHWSEPTRIQPFADGHEQPNNVWAPEVFRDNVAGDFKVVWSSTLPSELADGDGSADTHGHDHRMFYVSTRDFKVFSQPALLFHDANYSVIDAQVVYDDRQTDVTTDDRWVMALKKELAVDRGGKNIRLAFSPAAISAQSFTGETDPIVGPGSRIQPREAAEGPTLLRFNGQWLLYWDSYSARHYSLATSSDLVTWTDESKQLSMPFGHPRHGTPFVADRGQVSWRLTTGH